MLEIQADHEQIRRRDATLINFKRLDLVSSVVPIALIAHHINGTLKKYKSVCRKSFPYW